MISRLLLLGTVLTIYSMTIVFGAQEIIEKKITTKKQGWLGVSIQDVTPKLSRDKGLKVKEGVYVNEVVANSPAELAGIKNGDVVMDFNGKKVELSEDLTLFVGETAPESKVIVKVNRNGETKTISVIIGKNNMSVDMPFGDQMQKKIIMNLSDNKGTLEGMELLDLKRQLAEYFEVPNGRGVMVKEVKRKSNAEKAGFKAGDVITKIGKETVFDKEEVREFLYEYIEGESVSVEVLRKGKKMSLTLSISERSDRNNFFWQRESPGEFEFRFGPHMEKIEKELKLQHEGRPEGNEKKKEIRIMKKIDDV